MWRRRDRVPWGLIGACVLARMLLWLLVHNRYGYFRDELYYFACADHLAWGYVDHPPLSIAVLWLLRHIAGDSLAAVRCVPALADAVTIACCALLARELGGGRFAQGLAMLITLLVPVNLGVSGYYSMNSFDLLFWAIAALLVARLLNGAGARTWIWLGLVLGLGLLNKISVLWFGVGLVIGLVLSPQRRVLLTPWPWIAGALALIIFTPYLAWNARLGWPTLEFIRNAAGEKMQHVPYLAFIANEIVVANPLTLPIWVAGCVWLLRSRRYRVLGGLFVGVFVLLMLSQASRAYYLAPALTVAFAAGAVAWEGMARRARWIKPVWIAVVAVVGLFTLPLAAPVLPVPWLIAYQDIIGMKPPQEERDTLAELPQHFADMFGWEDMERAVAAVYSDLSAADRARAGIFARNYGEAGAIDFFGRRDRLPRAISNHNNYWLWGPDRVSGDVLIVIGAREEELRPMFDSVERKGTVECGYCRPFENHSPIHVCRGIKRPLAELWPAVKRYE